MSNKASMRFASGGQLLRLLSAALLAGLCTVAIAKQPARISAQDYVDILQLYAEFNTSLDLGLPDRYIKTWTDDGEFTGGRAGARATPPGERKPDVVGKVQLRAMARPGGSGGRHSVTNLVLTPVPGGAKATCYLILMNARTSPPTPGETAIYDDTLVKTKDGWKFKKRVNWRDDDPYSPNKPGPMSAGAGPPGGPPEASAAPPTPGAPPGTSEQPRR
jgi:hypothetical protein